MKTDVFRTTKEGSLLALHSVHIEPFLKHLMTVGYARRTLRKKRSDVRSFAQWTNIQQIPVDDLNDSHIAAFVESLPRGRWTKPRIEATLRPFIKWLHGEIGLPITVTHIDNSLANDLIQSYIDYLRNARGLSENSILVYVPFIRDFLTELVARDVLGTFDAVTIRNFLIDHTLNRSGEYSRLLATSLRSFLRFLFLHGDTAQDLSPSVPTVRRWGTSAPPAFLSPEEVERAISAVDRLTQRGCRDHAILLLLARLGLRAGEIVTLELDDILWRTGEIVVRSKGRMLDCLPLLSDIGEALSQYLLKARGSSTSRRVFLRMNAPRVGLTGPAAIGHIVRRALALAGINRPNHSASHIFRHSLATRMVRHGASLEEISEVLRHRSQNTTAVYAHVSFEALRGVARPWPGTGGSR
jgi:site-specific recombinase XerD